MAKGLLQFEFQVKQSLLLLKYIASLVSCNQKTEKNLLFKSMVADRDSQRNINEDMECSYIFHFYLLGSLKMKDLLPLKIWVECS